MQYCTIRLVPKVLGVMSMILKGHRLTAEPVEVPAHIAGMALRDYGAGVEVLKGTPVEAAPPLAPAQRRAAQRAQELGDVSGLEQIQPVSEGARKLLLSAKKDDAAALLDGIQAGAFDGEAESLALAAHLLGRSNVVAAIKARKG